METFLNYRRYLWLKVFGFLLVVLAVVYCIDQPIGGRNGGTVLGYTYGIFAALGILYLMWFGMRKRSYYSQASTLKSCLSAHVWLGAVLLVLVPLHSGFQVSFNLHGMAYILMVLTVLSGMYGAVIYLNYAGKVPSHRGGGNVKNLLNQISVVSAEIEAAGMGHSDAFLRLKNKLNFDYQPSLANCLFGRKPVEINEKEIAPLLLDLPDNDRQDGLSLISSVNKKVELCEQLAKEVAVQSWLKLWLYVHVPLSFACVAALLIHIVVVLYYI